MNKIIFSRGLLCAFLAGISSFSALADPVISEFLASNSTGLQDEDGQRNDWIEIFNPDVTAVNLDGWYLTDSKTNKTKWRIPNVTLAPRAYLFVWASNKNRSNPANPLHTNFRISASAGGYVGLIRPALTVASEFDAYPIQAADITYGLPVVQTTNTLVANAAAAKFTVPADGSLGTTWTAPGFADGGWTGVTSGVGFDLEPGPMPTVRLWADSQTEFSGTQGSNNWHYGIWNRTTDADKVYTPAEAFLFLRDGTTTLSAANHWNGSWALGGYPPWTGIGSTGGHPNGSNNGAEHWVLRRYVSEFTGSARLSGFVSHPAVSDGVGLHIFVDGREVYMHSAIRTRSHEFSINVPVQLGSLVDFFVDAGEAANDGGDSFNSIFRVQSGAIADSATDWSTAGTQGARNWRYGYYRRSADGDATYQTTDFTAFLRDATTTISATNHWDGTRWVLSTTTAPLTALNANGGVPQTTGATDWPVRRWTSPYAGRVAIHGIVGHPDAGSDGITGRLYLNGTQIFSSAVNNSNEPYLIFADVLVGSVLDFAIDPGATETADSNAGFTAFITPAASGAQLVADSITDWSTSGTQGALGWTYGMFDKITAGNVPYAANLFTAFLRDNTNTLSATNQWTGGQYDIFNGNPPWTELGAVSTHPNGDGAGGNQQWPIRRWTSTVAGSLTVQAHVGKLNTSGGGVTLKVFLNGVERDSFVIAGSSKIGSTRLVALEGVQVGDHIDIAVTPEGIGDLGDGADGCRFSARIYRNATPPNAVYSDVADSVLDWSTTGVQGFRGWTYGTHNEATPGGNSYTGANFIPFPRASGGWGVTNYWNGSYYDVPAGNPPWTELGQTGVHPNGINSTGGEQWIIRRWTSTTAGSLRLTYKAWKTNPNGSGVSIRAFHNGTQIDTVAVAGNNSTGTTRVVVIPNVAIGDNIDVALNPHRYWWTNR